MDDQKGLEDLQMITVKEASALLRLSATQIHLLLNSGQIPGVQFRIRSRAKWMIPVQQLRETIAKRQQESAEARAETQRRLDELFSSVRRRFRGEDRAALPPAKPRRFPPNPTLPPWEPKA